MAQAFLHSAMASVPGNFAARQQSFPALDSSIRTRTLTSRPGPTAHCGASAQSRPAIFEMVAPATTRRRHAPRDPRLAVECPRELALDGAPRLMACIGTPSGTYGRVITMIAPMILQGRLGAPKRAD